MKTLFVVAISVCLFPSVSWAQLPLPNQLFGSCGQVRWQNDARQYGQFGMWLEYNVFTTRDVNTCPISVGVEAHVPGVSNSGLSATGLFSASVLRQIPVPHAGPWESRGTHYFSIWIPIFGVPREVVQALPSTVDEVNIVEQREEEVYADPAYACEVMQGGVWTPSGCQPPNCPIIVDTGRDGYKLTSLENGVRFDLNADGIPEQVSWTKRDSDDAFLAMDRNGNGIIDDGTELFGNHTPVRPDSPDVTTPNGFEALKFVEAPIYGQSERNEVINQRDAAFSKMVLWRDLNHNGISRTGRTAVPKRSRPRGNRHRL